MPDKHMHTHALLIGLLSDMKSSQIDGWMLILQMHVYLPGAQHPVHGLVRAVVKDSTDAWIPNATNTWLDSGEQLMSYASAACKCMDMLEAHVLLGNCSAFIATRYRSGSVLACSDGYMCPCNPLQRTLEPAGSS